MILIVCAMESEAREIAKAMENIEVIEILKEKQYYKGTIKGVEVSLVITGVGKANASLFTGLVLNNDSFTHIINIGLVGGFKPNKIGDIVVIKDASYHDVDVTLANSMYEYGQIPNMPHPFLSDYELLRKVKKELNVDALSLYTGDKFITEKVLNSVGVYDMEGAAIYQVAYIFDLPIISVKIISDIIDSKTQIDDYNDSEESFDIKIRKIIERIINL